MIYKVSLPGNIYVRPGASVWETYESAKNFIERTNQPQFIIYGLKAQWGVDTRPTEYDFHELLIEGECFELEK